jgi:SAM-dependent methyltransferase
LNYNTITKKDYSNIAGPDWPSFDVFQTLDVVPDFIQRELESLVADSLSSHLLFDNGIEYLNFLNREYFYICQNRSILEIGANTGIHTDIIKTQSPNYYQVIEPNGNACTILKKNHPEINLIQEDVFEVLINKKDFDVVICFGVLYHLHSPLYLLELIANSCNPQFIMLDCVNDPDNLEFLEEPPNQSGNRFVTQQKKSCNFNLVAPFEIIAQGMKHLDYKLIKNTRFTVPNMFSKSNSWVGLWEKN